jgi:hypothetical protein
MRHAQLRSRPGRLAIGAGAVVLLLGLPATASTAATPERTAAPAGSFSLAFSDSFSGSSLSSRYSVMNGNTAPKNWSASQVKVHNGYLDIATTYSKTNKKWQSGAVYLNNLPFQTTYGKFLLRVRCTSGNVKCTAMLWPDQRHLWPPEIDFYELFPSDPARGTNKCTFHYGINHTTNHMIFSYYKGSFSQWHTIGVQWTPGKLQYLMDGKVMKSITNSNVPKIPMHLDMQTFAPKTPTGPVHLQVDSIRIYRYS